MRLRHAEIHPIRLYDCVLTSILISIGGGGRVCTCFLFSVSGMWNLYNICYLLELLLLGVWRILLFIYFHIFILPYTGVFHPQTKSNLNHIGLLSSICTLVFTLQKKVIKEMCIRLGLSRILKKNNITVLKAIMNPPHLPQIYHR